MVDARRYRLATAAALIVGPALFGVGALAVAIEGTVASNAYFIASSALFLAGGAAVAAQIRRLPDDRLTVVRAA